MSNNIRKKKGVMMCINNTVCDVLSSHHQPLREAVAACSEARKGSEAEALTQNSGVWPLAPGWASTELMKLSSEQSDINMDTRPFWDF